MDIEAVFAKAIQPYEERVAQLQEAEHKKELEIKELKSAILEMHRIILDYNAHNVAAAPGKGAKADGKRPQTAMLPSKPAAKQEKPEGDFWGGLLC